MNLTIFTGNSLATLDHRVPSQDPDALASLEIWALAWQGNPSEEVQCLGPDVAVSKKDGNIHGK